MYYVSKLALEHFFIGIGVQLLGRQDNSTVNHPVRIVNREVSSVVEECTTIL